LSLFWARRIKSTHHPISVIYVLIFSSYLRLGLLSGFLFRVFLLKFSMHSSPMRARCPGRFTSLNFIILTVVVEDYKSWSSSLCSSLQAPDYCIPSRSKYSSQHIVLKHP
jgi:hypothetical protein